MLCRFKLVQFSLLLAIISMLMFEGKFVSGTNTTMVKIAKPGCRSQCANLTVPYPFGIDKGCSMDDSFNLTCNFTYTPPKLFIGSGNVEIYNISDSEMRIFNGVASKCYNQSGYEVSEFISWTDLGTSPFTFSQKNKFIVTGCDDFAMITGSNGADFSSGCMGLCSSPDDVPGNYCSGIGCCQTSIPKGLKVYNTTILSLENHTKVWSFNPCGMAFLGEEETFKFLGTPDLSNAKEFVTRIRATVPTVLDWAIGGKNSCAEATECKENSVCVNVDTGGYRCSCNEGYQGNPYLDSGCQGQFQF